jgi:hypothetical protein
LAVALLFVEKSAKGLLYIGLDCGGVGFLSSNILLTSRNPKNNCWFFRNFVAQFGGKDRRLYPYNPWSQQVGWLEAFLYEVALNFEVFSNIQNWKQKNRRPIVVDVLF